MKIFDWILVLVWCILAVAGAVSFFEPNIALEIFAWAMMIFIIDVIAFFLHKFMESENENPNRK